MKKIKKLHKILLDHYLRKRYLILFVKCLKLKKKIVSVENLYKENNLNKKKLTKKQKTNN